MSRARGNVATSERAGEHDARPSSQFLNQWPSQPLRATPESILFLETSVKRSSFSSPKEPPESGVGPRHARTSTQRVGRGCMVGVLCGERRLSLETL